MMDQNSSFQRGEKGFEEPFRPGRVARDEIWRENYEWFEERGYQLRARWHPDWIPSWESSPVPLPRFSCEDSYVPHGPLADGIRTLDGKAVMMKHLVLPAANNELDIVEYLSSEAYRTKNENYCVPIYDILRPPHDKESVFVVMPLLRHWEELYFGTLGEVIGLLHQAFTGLLFLHRLNIAHCDCKLDNLLVDGSPLFDEEPHPVVVRRSKDFSGFTKPYSRTQRPVRYYWIDFELAYHHTTGVEPPLITRLACGDPTVPERFSEPPWDPFALDVYCAGNILKDYCEERNVDVTCFDCLLPLLDEMTRDDPRQRPSMEEVVERLDEIRRGLSNWQIRSRVRWKDELFIFSVILSVWHWLHQLMYMLQGLASIPPVPLRLQPLSPRRDIRPN